MEPDRAGARPADDAPGAGSGGAPGGPPPPGDPHGTGELVIRGLIDLPRGIVWDAIADPVLVAGWLGEADIDAVPGGRFVVRPGAPVDRRPLQGLRGSVSLVSAPAELVVESAPETGDEWSRIRFTLTDVPGGPRDRSTELTITVSFDPPRARTEETRCAWLTHLDQLRELLHGRPVDWNRWTSDWEPVWAAHRARPAA